MSEQQQSSSSSSTSFFSHASSFFQPVPEKKEWYEELEEEVCSVCPELSYQQRIIGCVVCQIVGFLISMGSLFRLGELLAGDPEPFGTMYTFGNLVSICSTCFLYGPLKQCKSMFAETRIVATAIFFFFMASTLFLAFYPDDDIPLRVMWMVFSIFFQFLALWWYTISFIPFAREVVKNFMLNTCCCCFKDGEQGQDESTFRLV